MSNYTKATRINENRGNSDDSRINDNKRSVRCTCPKCGITHLLKFFWSGKGTPRKYCHSCRETISGVNDQCVYEAIPDVFRVHRGASSQAADG